MKKQKTITIVSNDGKYKLTIPEANKDNFIGKGWKQSEVKNGSKN